LNRQVRKWCPFFYVLVSPTELFEKYFENTTPHVHKNFVVHVTHAIYTSATVIRSFQALFCTDLHSWHRSYILFTPVTGAQHRTSGTGLRKSTGSLQVCSTNCTRY